MTQFNCCRSCRMASRTVAGLGISGRDILDRHRTFGPVALPKGKGARSAEPATSTNPRAKMGVGDLSGQKRLASDVLGVGKRKVSEAVKKENEVAELAVSKRAIWVGSTEQKHSDLSIRPLHLETRLCNCSTT